MNKIYLHNVAQVKKVGDTLYVNSDGNGVLDEKTVIAEGAEVPRALKDRFAEVINVKDFGAKGDGATDDTAAIQAANDNGKPIYFPAGVYKAANLTMSTPWDMAEGASILYLGEGGDDERCITCTANNIRCGDIWIDGNGKELKRGLLIEGNGNYFRSVGVVNLSSNVRLTTAVLVTGDGNTIDSLFFRDLVNTGFWNDSSPQGLALSDSADGNVFHDVSSENCRSTVVNNATGTNSFGDVYSFDCKDNGFYAAAEGISNVGTIFYDGDDNGVGIRHNATLNCDSIRLSRYGSYGVFFGSGKSANIGSIFVDNGTNPILGLNETMSDSGDGFDDIYIGCISGKVVDTFPIFLPEYIGERKESVKSLTINSIYIDARYTSASSIDQHRASFMRFDACPAVHIGDIKVRIKHQQSEAKPFYIRTSDKVSFDDIVNTTLYLYAQSSFYKDKIIVTNMSGDLYPGARIYTDTMDVANSRGHIKLSNGMLICWGTAATSNGVASFNFEETFSSTPFVTLTVPGGIGLYATLVSSSVSGGQANVYSGTSIYTQSRPVYYMAIGKVAAITRPL